MSNALFRGREGTRPARPWRGRVVLISLLWLCLPALSSAAAVDLWVPREGPLQKAFIAAFVPALTEIGHRIGKIHVGDDTGGDGEQGAGVAVALGLEASRSALARSDSAVLSVLVSRRDAEQLMRENGEQRLGIIVLDQPARRRLQMLKTLLPGVHSVAILLGSASADLQSELEVAVRQAGLEPKVALIRQEDEIVTTLERLLDPDTALLAIPDPAIYNRNTVMSILLTSYRHRRPVIGFTAAYVRAGAVAAVFSDPQDVALQTARHLASAATLRGFKRGIFAPTRYRVAVNERVSRSLGLPVSSEADLLERLRSEEADE